MDFTWQRCFLGDFPSFEVAPTQRRSSALCQFGDSAFSRKVQQEETRRLFSVDDCRFISGIVSTRNHYTHYSTKTGRKILQGVELHWAIQKLTLLIRILSLNRAGVPEQQLHEMIRSHHRLAEERSVWQDMSEEGSEYAPMSPV